MNRNPLQRLHDYGQSIWFDNIARGMLRNGAIEEMITSGEITGITSNPTIFEKAIQGTGDYDDAIRDLCRIDGKIDPKEIFETLALDDVRNAADLLRRVYERTAGADGYVSLEVSPKLAHDTGGTIAEARRLFEAFDRRNAMIKVPATEAGLPAITTLISEGININVTLMFSVADVEQVALAYLEGLERRAAAGGDLGRIASVASFFVSRTDTAVDKLLPPDSPLRGTIAVANSKAAYARHEEIFGGTRFQALHAEGARLQRLLFGSTGTKNPAYSDVLYVEELIGRDTVNTVPRATLDAFRDHGHPRSSLAENLDQARWKLAALGVAGIDLDQITDQIKRDGVSAFEKSFDSLLATLGEKYAAMAGKH